MSSPGAGIYGGGGGGGVLHVPGVAEVDATLVGALVAAVLQADDALAGLELLVREVADVLVGLLRADARLAVGAGLEKHARKICILVGVLRFC